MRTRIRNGDYGCLIVDLQIAFKVTCRSFNFHRLPRQQS